MIVLQATPYSSESEMEFCDDHEYIMFKCLQIMCAKYYKV